MIQWPPCRRESRPWRQAARGGTRDDRMLTQITVTIPEPIRARTLELPGDLASSLDECARQVSELDRVHGARLAPLGGLLLRTEAVASSKIERITATSDDFARAMNGSRANASAVSMVAAKDATQRLMDDVSREKAIRVEHLLTAHARLMRDDPSEAPYSGRIRDMQNWVGGSDHSPRGAMLIPPPPEELPALVADLLAFSNRQDLPSLLQAAIAHAQFETLHPFTDGNGRIGRALVNAILRYRNVTTSVVVPIASALVARREQYFAHLDAFREGNAEPIVAEFARASRMAAQESSETAFRLAELPARWNDELGSVRAKSAVAQILEALLEHPVFTAADIESRIGGSTARIYTAIDRLVDAGIVRPLSDRKRDQVWGCAAVLDELDDLSARIEGMSRDSKD